MSRQTIDYEIYKIILEENRVLKKHIENLRVKDSILIDAITQFFQTTTMPDNYELEPLRQTLKVFKEPTWTTF